MDDYHSQVAEVNGKLVKRLEQLNKTDFAPPALSTEERSVARKKKRREL